MQETRQQRRARLRQLRQQGEGLLRRGFARQPAPTDLYAASITLAELIDAKIGARSAAAFAGAALALYEATIKANPPTAALACKKGCNWCCYSTVAATVPEILHVWMSARGQARGTGDIASDGKPPCLMLRDGACTIYAARPLMCRVANSLDWTVCREEFDGTNPDRDVPVSRVPIEHGAAVRTSVIAAMQMKGLDAGLYELASGIRECDAIGGDVVAAGWLAGGEPFRAATRLSADRFILAQVDRLLIGHKQA